MKKKLTLLSIFLAMTLVGCPQNTDSGIPSDGGQTPPPPIIHGSTFKEALEKDYSNMTVQYALQASIYEGGQEYGWEYYLGNGLVAVLDGNAAESYGTASAWLYYTYYKGLSYAYWNSSYYVTEGWIAKGSKNTIVGIDNAYFHMPYFLQHITEDDVEYVLGKYVVKENKVEEVINGLQFTFVSNNITYIDITINSDGYITKIRGFDDPENEDYGFSVVLSSFGSTYYPGGTSSPLPPALTENNIKTYAEMIGHEEDPDIYIEEIYTHINETVKSDEEYDIIAYPDDSIDVSYTYKPTNANKKDVDWISTNPEVVEILYSQESGHRYLRMLKEGEADVYAVHIDGYGETISSKHIKIKVEPAPGVNETENDVYRFVINGHSGENGHYVINADNKFASQAPYSITTWRMTSSSCQYSEIQNIDEKDITLLSTPNSSANFSDGFYDEVLFDFDNQQVNRIQFAYALFRANAKNSLDKLDKVIISTSNDGTNWTDIDVTTEVYGELSKATLSNNMSLKVLDRTFDPASMVRIRLSATMVGGTYSLAIALKDFVFAKNDSCHNFNDPDAVPVTSIVINSPREKLKVGYSMKLSAVVNPDNATNKNVKWVSSDDTVLDVDARSGLVTALKEGTATIHAVSLSDKNIVSNDITITAYTQETLVDPDNELIGNSYSKANVASGSDTFDVNFVINSTTQATLTLSIHVGNMKFDSVIKFSFDSYDSVTGLYTFLSDDSSELTIKNVEHGNSVELTYKVFGEENYTLGNASSGVILAKD